MGTQGGRPATAAKIAANRFRGALILPLRQLAFLILSLGMAARPSRSPWAQPESGQGGRFAAGGRGASLPLEAPPSRSAHPAAEALTLAEGALVIGYLEEGSDLERAREVTQRLREALLGEARVKAAMDRLAYSDIWPRACDGAEDMAQRLGTGEFDLAFATAFIYARQFRRDIQDSERFRPVPYLPILQFRMEEDLRSERGDGVERASAVFIGPGSRLWGKTSLTAEEIREEIEDHPMAFSNARSAAGYIYPLLAMEEAYGGVRPRSPEFCGSSASVVKHVVSGLIPIGASDMRTLRALGTQPSEAGPRVPLYQVLFETQRIPTDPLLLRADLAPERSELGRELKVALRSFFNNPLGQPVKGLWVENADPRAFESLARALETFDPRQFGASRSPSASRGADAGPRVGVPAGGSGPAAEPILPAAEAQGAARP